MISFRSVSLAYPRGHAPALRDVSLEIHDGEMLAVLGANGSGKSTLGRLTNALLIPTMGVVAVDGVDTADPTGMAFARRRVGMVFQNPDAGIVSASVEEDVAFALENQALPRPVLVERVQRTLDMLHLSALRRQHPLELTTSDRARVGLAAAVVGGPRYLIMDEATAYLDAADRTALLDAVAELRRATGMAVVLITHLMEEALLADRVAVLAGGAVAFSGTARELFAEPARARAWRLELPPLLHLQQDLRAHGLDLGAEPLLLDAAVERLCRL